MTDRPPFFTLDGVRYQLFPDEGRVVMLVPHEQGPRLPPRQSEVSAARTAAVLGEARRLGVLSGATSDNWRDQFHVWLDREITSDRGRVVECKGYAEIRMTKRAVYGELGLAPGLKYSSFDSYTRPRMSDYRLPIHWKHGGHGGA